MGRFGWLVLVCMGVVVSGCGHQRKPLAKAPEPPLAPLQQSGQPRLVVQTGHTKALTSVAFSPDNQRVLTGGVDQTARLWDVATGREVQRFDGHAWAVRAVAFGPDGEVLTGSEDQTARLWEVATGREIRSFGGHDGAINEIGRAHV